MTTTNAFRHFVTAVFLPAALAIGLTASVTLAQDQTLSDEQILKAKCSFCHSSHRVYRISPDQIRPVLERMRKMNPDWITSVDSEHIATVLVKLLNDPSATSARIAWLDAVERGEKLFNDPSLGTTGKSCASCHPSGSLKNVEDGFPKFNPALKRFVDIQEAIHLMINDKLKGTPFPPNDQKYFDLLAYLKSLK